MASVADPLEAERAAHAATKQELAAAQATILALQARVDELDKEPFVVAAENAVLRQTVMDAQSEMERLRAELMQTRRRLADVHKQVDSLQGSTARQPVSREFVSQLYQQLEHWKRLFEQQSNRFAECDLFVARLKSFSMIRLTEYTLLERNLQSSHDQLAEEMQRIRGVLESDSPQQPLFPAMRDRLEQTFSSLAKRHQAVSSRLSEIRSSRAQLQRQSDRANARLERANKILSRTRLIAKEFERLLRYQHQWQSLTSAVERAVADDQVVFLTADGYVCTSMTDLINGLTGGGGGGDGGGALELFPLPAASPQVEPSAEAEARELKSIKLIQREVTAAMRAREDLGAAVASYMVQKNAFVGQFEDALHRVTAIVREEIASFGSPDARDFRIKELEFEAGFLRDMVKNCLSDARAMADKTGEAFAHLRSLHARTISRLSAELTRALRTQSADASSTGVLIARIAELERVITDDHTRLTDDELRAMDERKLAATYVAALERNLEAARNSIAFLGSSLDEKARALADAERRAAAALSDAAAAAAAAAAVDADKKGDEGDGGGALAAELSRAAIAERLALPVDVFLSEQRAAYVPPAARTPLALDMSSSSTTPRRTSEPATPRAAPPPANPFSATGNGTAMPFTAVVDFDEPMPLMAGRVEEDDEDDEDDEEEDEEKGGERRRRRRAGRGTGGAEDSDAESVDSLEETFRGASVGDGEDEGRAVAEAKEAGRATSIFTWIFG